MPRNMSFMLTVEQYRNQTKTVTRRNGWMFANVGDVVNGCEKCQGLKKGEKINKLGQHQFIDLRWEPLRRMIDEPEYGHEECVKEGFPNMTPQEFVDMYCKHNKCTPETLVHRMEFIYKIYDQWEKVPDSLKTRKSLSDMGLRLADGQKPVAQKRRWKKYRKEWYEDGYYDLYFVHEAIPKKELSDAQKEALAKAQKASRQSWYCTSCGDKLDRHERSESDRCTHCRLVAGRIKWAKRLLDDGDFVIFDTETTGLDGEIIEIGIIDSNGKVLMNQRLNPISEIEAGATAVHGLTADILKDEPRFPSVYYDLKRILTSTNKVIIYNAAFDDARLEDTCVLHNLEPIEYASDCAMEEHAVYCGEWSDYYQSYRWQPLPGGDHSAVGDCKATLKILKQMAGVSDKEFAHV